MARETTVLSTDGKNLVNLRSISREGDNLILRGKLMGAWESTMVVTPQNVVNMLRLIFQRSVIGYVFALPFLLRKGSKKDKQKPLLQSEKRK